VLSIAFREHSSLSALDLERILSFDMEWLLPEEAEQSVAALIESGWLIGDSDTLQPVEVRRNVKIELGWFPRPVHLLSPPKHEEGGQKGVDQDLLHPHPVRASDSLPSQMNSRFGDDHDPRTKVIPRLVKFISRQSGLPTEEIYKRCERKMNAFSAMTAWLGFALIAREQGLDMNEIINALSVV